MVKKNQIYLPTDIINLIITFSITKCTKCGKVNIRKYYTVKNIYILICSKCIVKIIKKTNNLDYNYIIVELNWKIFQANQLLKFRNSYRNDLIFIDEKAIRNTIKQRIKENINNVLKKDYIFYKIASPNEIYKLLYYF